MVQRAEFDFVWIAHMDEKSFAGSKRDGFTLPEYIKKQSIKRDEIVLKRELYVAMTRAKRFCTISYALHSYTERDRGAGSHYFRYLYKFLKNKKLMKRKKLF